MNFLSRQLLAVTVIFSVPAPSEALEIDLRGVEFQVGEPARASALDSSVKLPGAVSLQVLRQTADTLQHYRWLKVKVVGFTDNSECSALTDCQELSRRRATLVYQWLLAQGVSASQVVAVEARGSDLPIDSNDMEEGRQRNRRVEVVPILESRVTPNAS